MKRKLISFDVFENIQHKSLSNAEKELVEAAPVLAKTLGVDSLELLSFGPEAAMFESATGDYIHSNYKFEKGALAFENITQVAIDQDSEKAQAKQDLGLLVDALLENKSEEATMHFDKYMKLPLTRRSLKEAIAPVRKEMKKAKASIAESTFNESRCRASGKMKGKKSGKVMMFGKKAGAKNLKEWRSLSENVFNFIDFKELGPVMSECEVKKEGRDIVAVKMPVSEGRTAAKMLKMTYHGKLLDTDLKVLRGKAKSVGENTVFAKAVAEMKRNNNISDADGLQESIENIIGQWPELMYLTQEELAGEIKTALETVNAVNFDDQICTFLAEGILRTAHGIYTDKVQRVIGLAGSKVNENSKDQYGDFKAMVDSFYPTLDESSQKEFQVYVDLYDALRQVYEIAEENNDEAIRIETAGHLNELLAIVQQEVAPDLSIAENAAGWLNHLIEASFEAWSPSNTPHQTIVGDHPQMAKNAKVPGNPGSNMGELEAGDASQGKGPDKSVKADMQGAWTNTGGNEVWPSLDNPYVPKASDFTMKGEKGVDKDEDATLDPHTDTWPALNNPYVPKPENSVFRMKGDDLVVDK